MRTTVSIDDELLAAAKRLARREGRTVGQVVEEALRRRLADDGAASQPGPPLPVFRGGTGPAPGVELTSNRALAEILDTGRDLESLR
ncbi:MAG TPA: CopG family transcriptional regulator [Mycobacteriales bacterium]|jgi:hypothetical protein|nr:CopG family transcriptional regulator [Mycobacteriales bacterium]